MKMDPPLQFLPCRIANGGALYSASSAPRRARRNIAAALRRIQRQRMTQTGAVTIAQTRHIRCITRELDRRG